MKNEVKNLFEQTENTLQQIADLLKIQRWKVEEIIKKEYSKEVRLARKRICYQKSKLGLNNPMFGKVKEEHHNYIGDVSDGKGYIMCLKPEWYTGRKGCKHVFKHHIVICEHLGITEIPPGFCVHHIDGNKINNNILNLSLMTTSAHMRLHQLERATTSRKA